jgi:hypothetical protein
MRRLSWLVVLLAPITAAAQPAAPEAPTTDPNATPTATAAPAASPLDEVQIKELVDKEVLASSTSARRRKRPTAPSKSRPPKMQPLPTLARRT